MRRDFEQASEKRQHRPAPAEDSAVSVEDALGEAHIMNKAMIAAGPPSPEPPVEAQLAGQPCRVLVGGGLDGVHALHERKANTGLLMVLPGCCIHVSSILVQKPLNVVLWEPTTPFLGPCILNVDLDIQSKKCHYGERACVQCKLGCTPKGSYGNTAF